MGSVRRDWAPVVESIASEPPTADEEAAAEALTRPTTLVADAHAAGLKVHPWTFRAENRFLPRQFRRGTAPQEHGDLQGEILRFLDAGIDGFFTDQPDVGVAAVAAWRA